MRISKIFINLSSRGSFSDRGDLKLSMMRLLRLPTNRDPRNEMFARGFTLIELLIVVAVIGILAAVIMQNFSGIRDRARDGERKSDLSLIQSAMEIYRSDIGSYPSQNSITASGVLNCNTSFTGGTPTNTYMTKIPCDPLNSGQHVYRYNATGNSPSTYRLIACLENVNDSQKDPGNDPACTGGSTNWSYTVTNP